MKINDIDWSKVPDILAKEQVRLLCHCSKRTALYYLKSGKLPCIYSGKKTRCYKIRKEDLMAFIEDRENHPEFYAVPEGWYKEAEERFGNIIRRKLKSTAKICMSIIGSFSKNTQMFLKLKRSVRSRDMLFR